MLSGTRWSLISAVCKGDAQAWERFSAKYRPPVLAYLAKRGLKNDAEDLAQEVFLRLLRSDVLKQADPARGRFRGLLRTITRRTLASFLEHRNRQKRGGGWKAKGLEGLELADHEPDEDFDREWVANLVATVLKRLREEHPNYHRALERCLIQGQPQKEVAEAMQISVVSVKNHVRRGRAKVLAYLQEEVWHYARTREEFQEELRFVASFLPS